VSGAVVQNLVALETLTADDEIARRSKLRLYEEE